MLYFWSIKCTRTTHIGKQMHLAINKDALLFLLWKFSYRTHSVMATPQFLLLCSCLTVKKGWAKLKFCLPSICTNYMGYTKVICIINERTCYWYSTKLILPPQNNQNFALKLLNGGTFGCKKGWATLKFWLPNICKHHMGHVKDICINQEIPIGTDALRASLVTTPERPKPCSKPLNGGAFGCKIGWAALKFWLPSVCTHHMGYEKDLCIIREVPWYWYSMNESVYHPRTPQILLWNCQTKVRLGLKTDVRNLNFVFHVFAQITWDVLKMFVSFRICLGSDTPRMSPLSTPERPTTLA